MNIIFTPTAWAHYTEWQQEDKKMTRGLVPEKEYANLKADTRETRPAAL